MKLRQPSPVAIRCRLTDTDGATEAFDIAGIAEHVDHRGNESQLVKAEAFQVDLPVLPVTDYPDR